VLKLCGDASATSASISPSGLQGQSGEGAGDGHQGEECEDTNTKTGHEDQGQRSLDELEDQAMREEGPAKFNDIFEQYLADNLKARNDEGTATT
jgi:hypothetical protein